MAERFGEATADTVVANEDRSLPELCRSILSAVATRTANSAINSIKLRRAQLRAGHLPSRKARFWNSLAAASALFARTYDYGRRKFNLAKLY
jgi:hypothetical protein